MSRTSRDKGQRGELQVAAIIRDLTGWDVRRRVRQHDADSDLEGVPGWAVEVKNRGKATLGDVRAWWAQAVSQAEADHVPVLFYKRQRGEWRAVWPSGNGPIEQFDWAVEGSIETWAMVAMEGV